MKQLKEDKVQVVQIHITDDQRHVYLPQGGSDIIRLTSLTAIPAVYSAKHSSLSAFLQK